MSEQRDVAAITTRISCAGWSDAGGGDVDLIHQAQRVGALLRREVGESFDAPYYQNVTSQMRLAAELLEKFNHLYAVDSGAGEWSPNLLRKEADYLAGPIPGEAS